MTDLSIIVLSYNTSELTVKCLSSLLGVYPQQFKSGDFEIVVVDNASSDDSISRIKHLAKKNKNLKIVENIENLGFGEGNNVGVRSSKGEFCLFLNSDTRIEEGGLTKMVEFMKSNNNIGITGGKLYNSNGSLQPSVGTFFTVWTLFLTLFGGERLGLLRESPAQTKKVDWVSGAFMLVRKEIFKKIGMFDKNIFMYVEDMELCFRMKNSGFEVYFFPNTSAIHEKIGSSSKEFAISSIYKGTLYFFKKHKNKTEYELARVLLSLKARLAIMIGLLTSNAELVSTYKKALSF